MPGAKREYLPWETRKIRVVHALPTLQKGGTEGQVSRLSAQLQERGCEVTVIAVVTGGSWEDYLREHSVPTVILRCQQSAKVNIKAVKILWTLVKVLRTLKPDIVNGFLYPVSVWSSLAGWLADVPVVIASRRDCGFQRAEAPLPRWLERLSYLVTTRFTANSRAVMKSLQQHEGIKSEQVEIIYNSVDLPAINLQDSLVLRKKLGIPDSTLVVGMIANFWPHKNHLMLVRAAKQVVAQQPNVAFILSGGYYWTYQRQIEAEIAKLDLEAHFRIVGQIESASNLLPDFDIGVLCSQSEGFSNTILEYMAYGKPVIATRVGGNSEAVIEGETGYLVELGDTAGLANAIITLIRDPVKRVEMGRRGRARAETEFSWNTGSKRWKELFHSLLQDKEK